MAWIRAILGIILVMVLAVSISEAAEKPAERKGLLSVGEIMSVTGKAVMRLVPEEIFRPAVSRQELVTEDMVKTAPGGRLSILFRDETQLKLASNTTLIIKEVTASKEKTGLWKILLRLESGEVWTRSKGVKDGVVIETPYATAAIRGTEWSLSVKENESRVVVLEGDVQLSNSLGSITVGRNEEGVVTARQAPMKSILVMPGERTQWTHYVTEKRLLRYLRFGEGRAGRGEVLFNEGRLEESGKVFEEMISREPQNGQALTGLGLNALKKGEYEKAETYLDRSLKEKKELLALLGKAYLLIAENRPEEAGEIIREAKRSYPKEPLSYIFSSYLEIFYGGFPEALKECDRGLGVIPNDPLLLAFKVEIYLLLDRGEEARATVERLVSENPQSSEGYEKLGFYHRIVTGDSEKARGAIEKSIELDPFNDEAIARLADLLREQGHIPEALRLIQKALSIAPWNAMHHYTYGRLLADINRIDEAREQFRISLDFDPSFSRVYLGEGIVLLKEGRTDEALKELSKANLFEPNLSEIHSFLGIGYYQKQEVKAALEELRKAEECDPLDSTPHQLASAIYNDLYMPVESIGEARKVLELLPYRKASGEALLEGAQNGTMSVNYGLNFLGLAEWSLYYAQKALFTDPYRNTSHIGVAQAYLKLGEVSGLQGFNEFVNPYFSELLQGQTLNVNSLNYSNRYNTLISKPGHYVTLGGTYGRGDSEEGQADVLATGDFGSRFPLTYRFRLEGFRDSGHLPNSKWKEGDVSLTLGYKPTYQHDVYMALGYLRQNINVPPSASLAGPFATDGNQEYAATLYNIQLGYHFRLGPTSHLLVALRFFRSNDDVENPDFERDRTGFAQRGSKARNASFGIRHMFTLFENHQASYGFDYNYLELDMEDMWPPIYPTWIKWAKDSLTRRSFVFYAYDRWAISPRITLDMGIFPSFYSTEADLDSKDSRLGSYYKKLYDKEASNLNLRLGVSFDLNKKGMVRVAYQRRSTPGFLGELEPIGCAGLIPPTFDIEFNEAQDVQGSVEYELADKTFVKGSLGYQRLFDLTAEGGSKRAQLSDLLYEATHFFFIIDDTSDKKAQLWYGRFALNQILDRHFSFSLRYNYNNSKFLDGSGRELPGIPKNSGDASLVFVHPWQIQLSLRESYTGKRYADRLNAVPLKGYFSTDFSAQKEFLKKRLSLSFSLTNLFDQKYETLRHPFWWYAEALPAKGRTLFLRGEYRF